MPSPHLSLRKTISSNGNFIGAQEKQYSLCRLHIFLWEILYRTTICYSSSQLKVRNFTGAQAMSKYLKDVKILNGKFLYDWLSNNRDNGFRSKQEIFKAEIWPLSFDSPEQYKRSNWANSIGLCLLLDQRKGSDADWSASSALCYVATELWWSIKEPKFIIHSPSPYKSNRKDYTVTN